MPSVDVSTKVMQIVGRGGLRMGSYLLETSVSLGMMHVINTGV